MKVLISKKIFIYLIPVIIWSGCFNPFAPTLDEKLNSNNSPISDLTKVDGIFQNMQYAYSFQDTTIYGDLLANDFSFTYHNYDKGFDEAWGRDEEMRATYGLFQNSQRLDLIWNNIVLISTDSTNIVRSYNLAVTYNPTDVDYADGKVNLTLRKSSSNKWQIIRWIDESNF
jgi:hypothetical protein